MKTLIFDFDGTIADTKSIYYNALHHELGMMGFSDDKITKVIDIGLSLKKTFNHLGFSFITSWFLHKQIMRNVKNQADNVKKCKDADSLKEIRENKILVTNSTKEFVTPIIKHLKLKKYFSEVYTADDFSDKGAFIKDYMKKNKLGKNQCFYIGDRVADVSVAEKAGCQSVIVAGKCAWNSKKDIIKAGPDFIVDDIKGLKKIISRL